jgi:amino acid permease
MFKKISKTLVLAVILFASAFAMPVYAQSNNGLDTSKGIGVCTFIKPICDAIGISNTGSNAGEIAQNFVRDRLSLIVSLVFIAIILISVFIIIRAAITYIQSQGEEGKIQKAQKAIKSVFIGIGVLFVGIIGLILVLVFFNGLGFLNPGGNTQNCGFGADGVFRCGSGTGNNNSRGV